MGSTLIGKYKILDVLGTGGMGMVYKARDPDVNRHVAIKVVQPDMFMKFGDALWERFRVEAEAAGKINHPNIVTTYEFNREPVHNSPYIVMEFVEGRTLKQCIDDNDKFGFDVIISIIQQILSALACAHKMGIVHRDIKSENIMLTPDRTVKITDFGIARLDSLNLTQLPGQVAALGTIRYASPEQWLGQNIDHRTDLYSTGVILYELLTGQNPFTNLFLNKTDEEIADLKRSYCPPLPSVQDPAVPNGFDAIILKALATNPKKRYTTADEFCHALASVGTTTPDDDTRVKPSRASSSRGHLITTTPARIALLILVIVTAVYSNSQDNHTPNEPTDRTDLGMVTIKSNPPGAVVVLDDGKYLGTTPANVQLTAGVYRMIFQKNGYNDLDISVEVEPETTIPLEVSLSEKVAANE